MDNIAAKALDLLRCCLAVWDGCRFVFQDPPEVLAGLFGLPLDTPALTGDALSLLSDEDVPAVTRAIFQAKADGVGIRVYFPLRERGNWLQIDGWADAQGYCLLFSGMAPKFQLFQHIAEENADDIYVIDRSNYDLLYANDLKRAYCRTEGQPCPKCYQLVYGKDQPCAHCTLCTDSAGQSGSELQEKVFEHGGRFYTTRFQPTQWNGVPALIKYVRDITEEVQVKKEKDRLETYFQTVLKYLPGGVAVVHHTIGGALKPEYLSDGFSKMVRMTPEETWATYQDSAMSGVHPDDRSYVRQSLDRCIQQRCEHQSLQYRLRTGDGDYIWVNANFSVIQRAGGSAMVYADYHDITQERQMQEQLRQQYRDQIFQHYLITGPDALVLGHCNVTKNRITEIKDRTQSDLLARFGRVRENFFLGLGTLIPDPQERQLFYSKYLNEPSIRAFEAGITEVVMPCYLQLPGCSHGSYVQFKVNLVETPDTGDITGILTVTDITEKTIREKILLALSSLNYDLVVDLDFIHDRYRIVSGGDANISEVCGCHSQRVRQVVDQLVIDSEKEIARQKLDPVQVRRCLEKQGTYSFTYSIQLRSGEVQTKSMIVSPIDLRLGRACMVRTDVTEMLAAQRKTQSDLEKALSQAREASRVKSDFLSSMSHDIRTPMNAIVGMTTLALANLTQPQKVQDYLRKISISSQHLLSLINDVLDMSQIEQSKIHINLQPITIDEVVDQVRSIMTAPATDAGLHFLIELDDAQHPAFLADVLRIKQILINLLSNACKFTMEGGTVRFQAALCPERKPGQVCYRFTVADTGIGMSEEFMAHLFEPFTRSDHVSRVEGTGLGLSITKGLVDLMGGTIQVHSQPGQGTTFQVELCFDAVDTTRTPAPKTGAAPEAESLQGRHFLLVEDNAINSEILGELLQMRGATYVLKEDGAQAVSEFQSCPPGTYDAIFMDIQMPVMNGYETARAIRQLPHPDAGKILILAMTANAFAEDVQMALDSGMNGHIAKPVDMTLLCRTLAELLPEK